jgi:hypothetical protein
MIAVHGEALLLGDPHKVETSQEVIKGEVAARILTRRVVHYVEGSRSVALEHDPWPRALSDLICSVVVNTVQDT